jgi:dephospho-CoA kinase
MQRDALTREEVLRRIGSQMSDGDMVRYADEVIENDGTLEELHERVGALLSRREYAR